MNSIVTEALPILAMFAPAFNPPTYQRAQLLAVAAILTTGRRTVSNLLRTVKHLAQKPELLTRKRFKNGEFTVSGLRGDKYLLQIASPLYIPSKLEYDFKSDPGQIRL